MASRKGQTALITGASTGIGLALAECFAEDGCDLILTARSAAALQAESQRLTAPKGGMGVRSGKWKVWVKFQFSDLTPTVSAWTESVAVGGREFVEAVQRQLGDRGRYREIEEVGGIHILREPAVTYGRHVPGENTPISTNWA